MKHFINLKDIPAKDLRKIIADAKKRKILRKKLSTLEVDKGAPLKGKLLIQMFEKSSLRTRLSFYLAIKQLGGGTITLRSNELHLGQGGESIADTAKILSTYGDGFMLRTDSNKKIENFEKSKVKPDIVPIAKGIGGGFPIGAVLLNKKVASSMTPGTHGSTFGGNPLAMSVGNAVMDIISKKKFLNNIKSLSKYFLFKLNKIQEKYPSVIKQIRGKGFLIGIQLYKDQTRFIKKLMDNQLLTIRAAENVVRILPPLNVKKNEIDISIKIIEKVCSQIK